MPEYIYSGLNHNKETVHGMVQADTNKEAITALKQKKLIITSLKPATIGSRWIHYVRKKVREYRQSSNRLTPKQMKHLLTKLENASVNVAPITSHDEAIKLQQAGEPIRFKEKKKQQKGKRLAWNTITSHPKAEIKHRIPYREVVWFTKQLGILLASGVSLASALDTLYEHNTNKHFKHVLHTITQDIYEGNPLSTALSRYPNQFSGLYVALVSVGESSGTLPKCLEEITRFLEVQQKVSGGLKTAAIYPIVLLSVLLTLMIAGSYLFIPMFKDLLSDLDMDLPALTKTVFYIAENIIPIIAGFVIFIFLLHYPLKKIKTLGQSYIAFRDRILLRLPIVRDLVTTSAMFYFTYTMSLMLHNGVRMVDSLLMAQNAVDNKIIQAEVHDSIELVGEGVSLSEALGEQAHFSPIIRSMIYTGEESGRTSYILEQLGLYYADLMDAQIKNTIQFMQPTALLAVAAVIVPVLFAVLLPILDLSSGQFI